MTDALELGAGKPDGRKRECQAEGEEHQAQSCGRSHQKEAVRPRPFPPASEYSSSMEAECLRTARAA